MSERLTVVLNGESQLEYDRAKDLADDQRGYLDRMDAKMDAGIELAGRTLPSPDALQRAQFVALQLLQAVQSGDEGMAAATCTYLAVRIPELKQVRGVVKEGESSLDLVFDQDYAPELKLNFVTPEALRGPF